jgi:hypothetical protein
MKKGFFEQSSIENQKLLRKYLKNQVALLSFVHLVILPEKVDEGKWGIIFPLFYAVIDSYDALLTLTQLNSKKVPKLRDCLVISRTIIEIIINIVFVFAKGKSAVKNAYDHYMQKAFRNLDRELQIDDQILKIGLAGEVDLNKNPRLKKALDDFTSKRGREITKWTPETPVEKIEVIHRKYGPRVSKSLQLAFFQIYRLASEIVHGSFFGAMFLLGFSEPGGPPKNETQRKKRIRAHLSLTLMMVYISGNSLLRVLAKELPDKQLGKKIEELSEKFRNEERLKNIG